MSDDFSLISNGTSRYSIVHLISSMLVELEGVEPSSKQGTKMLSTCLAGYWFSCRDRKRAPKPCLSFFISSHSRSLCATSPKLRAPCDPVGIRHLHRQNVLSRFAEPGLSHLYFIRLGSKSEVVIANCCFANVFTGLSATPGMLTNPSTLLSKPVSPEMDLPALWQSGRNELLRIRLQRYI